MALQTISESVYVGLCLKIGTPQQVAIRRDVVDIRDLLENKVKQPDATVMMVSGSRKEGFRLKESDIDIMYWSIQYPVLWDFSQATLYNTQRQRLVLCDSSDSPPGFTLLWLPLEKASRGVLSSCVRINGALYISSAKFRDNAYRIPSRPDYIVHGPCRNVMLFGTLEYDHAYSFVSDFWPPPASLWVERCYAWPSSHVVNDIVRSGCHFVAIGHKHGYHADNEWRISFSQAEQKLVFAMNHTQFLTYGLLKLFLKEFNRKFYRKDKLLCSYHMKTTIFWAIQQNTITHWCPQNLLAGFWVCFKLLLKWVYEGVCPNFFIPENNMFLNNVHGAAQIKLFNELHSLYENGIAFLLHIPFINSYIMNVLCNPRLSVCTDECTVISEAMLDVDPFSEIDWNDSIPNSSLYDILKYLQNVEQLIWSPLTQCQIITLQKLTATTLQRSAFMLLEMYTNRPGTNKDMYIADKISCHMLKLAAKFGFVSDLLYMAMFYYKTFRYREALTVIEMTKVKLAQPGLMYDEHVDPERYTEVVRGQSWSNKMRHAVAQNLLLDKNIYYISELIPEQQFGLQKKEKVLQIPPFILLHMLEVLCYKHVEPMRAKPPLDDLEFLIYHDQAILVPVLLRDISLEILGICQQITGNHRAALYSYLQSLQQIQFSEIQTATHMRIQDLHLFQHTN